VPDRPIQEQFGERVIQAFTEFARTDLKRSASLEKDEFAHVGDVALRKDLAQVLYGTRWLYKLGLALLTQDEERAAHVRAQLVDYGTIVEGLLVDCVAHAIRTGRARGTAYQFSDPDIQRRPIRWNAANPEGQISRQSFWWLIRISHEFGVIPSELKEDLDWLRERRNTVHLRRRSAMGQTAFINQSRKAFELVISTIRETKEWKRQHS